MTVFLSHSHSDKDIVRAVGLRLQRLGVKVWIDEGEIKAGDSLIQKISEGIADAKYVLAFISKTSISAPWVQRELSIAITREIKGKLHKVVPIILEDVDIPAFLEDKLYIDIRGGKFSQDQFNKLLSAVDVTPIKEATAANLDQFDYHAAIELDGEVILFASTPSTEEDIMYRDPDGTRFPLKELYLIAVREGKIYSRRFGTQRIGHSCLGLTDNTFRLFANVKVQPLTYSMNGFIWGFNRTDLSLKFVKGVFEGDNWGWFPVLNDGIRVDHFSYREYFRVQNDKEMEKVSGEQMERAHVSYISRLSAGLCPNSSERIAEIVRSRVA